MVTTINLLNVHTPIRSYTFFLMMWAFLIFVFISASLYICYITIYTHMLATPKSTAPGWTSPLRSKSGYSFPYVTSPFGCLEGPSQWVCLELGTWYTYTSQTLTLPVSLDSKTPIFAISVNGTIIHTTTHSRKWKSATTTPLCSYTAPWWKPLQLSRTISVWLSPPLLPANSSHVGFSEFSTLSPSLRLSTGLCLCSVSLHRSL